MQDEIMREMLAEAVANGDTSTAENLRKLLGSLEAEACPFTIKDGVLTECDTNVTGVVVIPKSVSTIGRNAFMECRQLSSVIILNSVTTICEDAFYACESLTSITLPYSVTTIGARAFRCCRALEDVTMSNKVAEIGNMVFEGCHNLQTVNYVGTPAQWEFVRIGSGNADLLNKVVCIDISALPNMRALIGETYSPFIIVDDVLVECDKNTCGHVEVPENVTEIGDGAFSKCHSLTSITLPDTVVKIGAYAFAGLSKLSAVNIPKHVSEIGDEAFSQCCSISSLVLPGTITRIGDGAFEGCEGLVSVTYDNDKEHWDSVQVGDSNSPLKAALDIGHLSFDFLPRRVTPRM